MEEEAFHPLSYKREIKFRAWDEDRKEMLYYNPLCSSHIACNKEGFYIPSRPLLMDWVGDYYVDGEKINLIFEQFTGYKDIAGNDIYDGDIIKIQPRPSELNPVRICYVRIMNYGPQLFIGNDIYSFCAYNLSSGNTMVIGNIHENMNYLED